MRVVVAVAVLASGLVSSTAAADDTERERRILDEPGPPDTPGLSHRDLDVNFEYTIASIEPIDAVTGQPITTTRAYAYAARLLVEYPLLARHWYVGVMSDVAAGSVPGSTEVGGNKLVFGNPEIWVRGMWASSSGLGAGGGVSLVAPIPRSFNAEESVVVRAIRTVRPWDYPHFQELTMTARPFFDIRHIVGPLTIQMRQGLDFSLLVRDRADDENRYDLTALGSLYLGVRPIDELTLALQLTEVYQLTADVSSPTCAAPCDERRVSLSLSPIVQLRLHPISPSISVLLPLSTPLRAEVQSYYAARLNLDIDLL